MPPKSKGLGKGLGALIPGAETAKKAEPKTYPISRILPNSSQPRRNFDDEKLAGLMESIKSVGIIEPLILRRLGDGYMLIAGERRLRAAKKLGWTEVPAVVVDDAVSDHDALYMALIENSQREDLNPIELAEGIKHLMEAVGANQETVAQKMGLARSTVANLLRLLTLPQEVRQLLIDGVITTGHAKSLLALESPEEQIAAAEKIADGGLTVREAENLVQQVKKKPLKRRKTAAADPALKDAEERLAECFQTKALIKPHGKGGHISLYYYSIEELNSLLERLLRR